MSNPYLRPSWWTVTLLVAALCLCAAVLIHQDGTIRAQKSLIRGLWSDVQMCQGFCRPKPPAQHPDPTRQQ